jgi:hypothetical protein
MDLIDYEDAWEFAEQNREDWQRGMFDDEEETGDELA